MPLTLMPIKPRVSLTDKVKKVLSLITFEIFIIIVIMVLIFINNLMVQIIAAFLIASYIAERWGIIELIKQKYGGKKQN